MSGSVKKFRSKPVVKEAIQLTPETVDEVQKFLGAHGRAYYSENVELFAVIDTLEGKMYAFHDDWIIKGIAGEFYPCQDDIFKQTYEPV